MFCLHLLLETEKGMSGSRKKVSVWQSHGVESNLRCRAQIRENNQSLRGTWLFSASRPFDAFLDLASLPEHSHLRILHFEVNGADTALHSKPWRRVNDKDQETQIACFLNRSRPYLDKRDLDRHERPPLSGGLLSGG